NEQTLREPVFSTDDIRHASEIACDPALFVLLFGVFRSGASGKFPVGEVVIGKRENAKRFNIPASPFSQGMVAVLAELKARRINGDKLTAYMTRVIALMDVLSDPGAAREFVRPGDEPGHVVFSESLVGASAATAMHSNPSLRMRGPRPNHSAIDTEMLVA